MIKLTLKDRFEISTILPEKGDLLTLGIVKDISKRVSITQEEIEKFEVKSVDKGFLWNEDGATAEFEIDFSNSELEIIRKEIKSLDDKREVPIGLYDLCLKLKA